MVRISIDLVRKRSEHNEGHISTLEELSLHQEDIERIEFLQNWCRDLKILYLQSNLIPKIENMSKLKRLEYLNLALNNIERVENLEGCESLQKLDLTLNFIGELTSIDSLQENIHLESLYLTGNPCADFVGYRDYVIATLPQLQTFDSQPIERSHRIRALQNYHSIRDGLMEEQEKYRAQREKQKNEKVSTSKGDDQRMEDSAEVKRYWNEICDNSPETRVELANQVRRQKEEKKRQIGDGHHEAPKRVTRLFKDDGSPLSINEARLPFALQENEESNCLVLTLEVYRHLDTSLINADVQPSYVRVHVKEKLFQITLPENVHPDQSTAQRSQTTGHLVITMPMVNNETVKKTSLPRKGPPSDTTISEPNIYQNKRQYLEIGGVDRSMDFSQIMEMSKKPSKQPQILGQKNQERRDIPRLQFDELAENPEVPPLE